MPPTCLPIHTVGDLILEWGDRRGAVLQTLLVREIQSDSIFLGYIWENVGPLAPGLPPNSDTG